MLGWIIGKFTKPIPKKWYDNLPKECRYDMDADVVVMDYRGVRGYFKGQLAEQMVESGIDFVEDFKKSVDEVFDREEEDES